jgi:anhydro-N-acetylmuramic acid kinase
MLVIGLMSGTSLDGIDAALVRLDGEFPNLQWKLESFQSAEYSAEQRNSIHDALHGNAEKLTRINTDIGEWFAQAVLQLCKHANVSPNEVDLIGSHGQTIWHIPPVNGKRGSTLQLGCAATIAERTGIDVVSDFRSRDMAAMGQGAPLVPWIDRLLFTSDRKRVLLNIGGIGNLTWLPARGSEGVLQAFDTGPGNGLMNAATEIASGGKEAFDRDGKRAASAPVDEALLSELLAEPYYSEEPPKSTGRELFGKPYVQDIVRRHPQLAQKPDVLISTLTELTARTIASAIERWVLPKGVDEVIATGGGGRNPELMRRLQRALGSVPLHTGEVLGLDPDAKEAVAFAALAWAHVKRVPGNVPEATGAQGPRVLGSFTPGRA